MAFITYPLNNIDYTAEDAELFHCTRTSGIWAEDSFPISVTGADNNVTIGTGIAWINNEEFSGKVAALKSAEVLDLGIADSTYPRIDVIAIQFNANNNATDVIVKKGTPASNPVRPAIVRNGAVYELYLASVYRPAGATAITATHITDLRMDETVCGLMADSVTRIDMTAIEAQVKAFINKLQSEVDSIKDLSGLMLKSDWADGDVIPIRKGGTGANNAEQALMNLGGISMNLLWENAYTQNDFPHQTLNIKSQKYDFLGIELATNATDTPYQLLPMFIVPNIDNRDWFLSWAYIWNFIRTVTTNKSNGTVEFGDGVLYRNYGNSTTEVLNNYLIPYRIYGIKGVQ